MNAISLSVLANRRRMLACIFVTMFSSGPVAIRRLIQAQYLSLVFPNFRFLVLFLAAFCVGGGADLSYGADKVTTQETRTQQSPGTKDQMSPQKLYEALSGFQEVFTRKRDPSRKAATGNESWRFNGPKKALSDEPDLLKMMEIHKNLASKRIDRQEWDLAIAPLERALKLAQIAELDEASWLQYLLGTAKANSTGLSPASSLTPGEITNSVGMRLVAIPAGSFLMGSSDAEIRRIQNEWNAPEGMLTPETPVHKVEISKPFFMGKYHVTVGQFRMFVNETGYRTFAEKQGWGWVYDENKKHWIKKPGVSWKNPGIEVWEDHPVTLVCHSDAEAFCEWLSRKDNRQYHLPTEAQWEYAARGGLESKRFPWGDEYPDAKRVNVADRRSPTPWGDKTMDDGYARWSPVGSYRPAPNPRNFHGKPPMLKTACSRTIF